MNPYCVAMVTTIVNRQGYRNRCVHSKKFGSKYCGQHWHTKAELTAWRMFPKWWAAEHGQSYSMMIKGPKKRAFALSREALDREVKRLHHVITTGKPETIGDAAVLRQLGIGISETQETQDTRQLDLLP